MYSGTEILDLNWAQYVKWKERQDLFINNTQNFVRIILCVQITCNEKTVHATTHRIQWIDVGLSREHFQSKKSHLATVETIH